MKYIFLLVVIFCVACGDDSNETSNSLEAKAATGLSMNEFAGMFYDSLPCEGCPGIGTKVYFKPDSTAIVEEVRDKKNIVYHLGRWMVADSIITLRSGTRLWQFGISSHAQIEVLDKGSSVLDSTTKRLVMRRNNVPFTPLNPIPVEGVFWGTADTMHLYLCSLGRAYPAAISPEALKMKTAYNSAVPAAGQKIYARVAGHFELRPALNDTITRDYFVIDKFSAFSKTDSCQ